MKKLIEQAVAENEKGYYTVLDSIIDPVITIDDQGLIESSIPPVKSCLDSINRILLKKTCFDHGVAGYMIKPVDFSEIDKRILVDKQVSGVSKIFFTINKSAYIQG